MPSPGVQALVLGGILCALAAAAHLACILVGARAYRLMGAGEGMARAVEAGSRRPALVTAAIAMVLFAWAAYAFSGAGLIDHVPLTRLALPAISVAFLARGLAFPLLKPSFPENSLAFWLVSSGICVVLGLLYGAGAVAVWTQP